jgi:hypothetical protein
MCIKLCLGTNHLEGLGVDGRILLKWILGWEGVDWIYLAEDKVQWWAVVNTVTNTRVPLKTGSFWTTRTRMNFSRRNLFHEALVLDGS